MAGVGGGDWWNRTASQQRNGEPSGSGERVRRDDPRRVRGGLPPQMAPSVPTGKVESYYTDCVLSCEIASTAIRC